MTADDLTPQQREEMQEIYLRRWLAIRCPQGTRRQTDTGRIVPVTASRPDLRQWSRWYPKPPAKKCADGCGRPISFDATRCVPCAAVYRRKAWRARCG